MNELKEKAFKEMEEDGLINCLPNDEIRVTDKGIIERNKIMILLSLKE